MLFTVPLDGRDAFVYVLVEHLSSDDPLDDLTRAGDDQLLARELTPAALVTLPLLKTARGNPQITADLRRWAGHLRAVLDQPGVSEAFIVLLTYIELVKARPGGALKRWTRSSTDQQDPGSTLGSCPRCPPGQRTRPAAASPPSTARTGPPSRS